MRQGDAEGAVAKYLESMQHLKSADQTPEVCCCPFRLNTLGCMWCFALSPCCTFGRTNGCDPDLAAHVPCWPPCMAAAC